jgi:hypothetical protein
MMKRLIYTATLIPEGSWIRFSSKKIQKLIPINIIKNQEDEVVIQLDKINQNRFFIC